MTNYLSYLGLGFIGYFFGFQFVFLCNAAYNAIYNGNQTNYYKLFMMYLLYSMGFLKSMYTLLIILIYNFLSNYETNVTKTNKILEEYQKFMKFYDEETTRDPTKSSSLVEYWKLLLSKCNILVKIYDDLKSKMQNHRYYETFNNLSSLSLIYYFDKINQFIDSNVITLIHYFKLGNYYDTIKNEMKKINDNLQPSQQQSSQSSVTPLSNMPNMLNMQELDELIKSSMSKDMPNIPNIDEFIASLNDPTNSPISKDIPNIPSIDEFIASLNEPTTLKKRKKKIPKRPPPGFNKKT